MSRIVKTSSLLVVMLLAGCGFHLRQSVSLPTSMQRVHLTVSGGGDLQRILARSLRGSGVTVEDASGPGIAELVIPTATFSNEMLSVSGFSRVIEYAVHYTVRFSVSDGRGSVLIPAQDIRMSREYSYDAGNTIGNNAQVAPGSF